MNTAPHWLRDRRAICGIIVLATLATFGATITHDFVGGWDDGPLIVNNDLVHPPTTESLARIWSGPHARMYIPAVYTTWWALAQVATVGGTLPGSTTLNPSVFHLANLLVHTLNALLVFAILRIVLERDWPAAAGALLFALHPLQTEAVAWATGMKDLLWAFFGLLALWQYIVFATTKTDRPAHYAMATIAFALALLAKPSAVVVPFVAGALLLLVGRRGWAMLLPWALMSAAWMVVTTQIQPTPEIPAPQMPDRALIAVDSLGFYLFKLIWPARLGIDYGLRPEVMLRTAYWAVAAIAALVVALSRSRALLAGGLIFVAGVLPVLGLTPFVFQWLATVADRYIYLSMLGPALALAWVMTRLHGRGAAIACAVVLGILGFRSIVQATTWADSPTLMRHALKVNPKSPAAHNHLGDHLFNQGDLEGARAHFAAAVDEKHDYLTARDNLASALVRLERPAEALPVLRETLRLRRSLPEGLKQPIEQDLARIEAVEGMIAPMHRATAPSSVPAR